MKRRKLRWLVIRVIFYHHLFVALRNLTEKLVMGRLVVESFPSTHKTLDLAPALQTQKVTVVLLLSPQLLPPSFTILLSTQHHCYGWNVDPHHPINTHRIVNVTMAGRRNV